MEELAISPYFLAAIFLVVSSVYSSVGLGGGTSYTALLAIFGASYWLIPMTALALNVVVTAIATFNYVREGHARAGIILPFVVTSIPMSYVGGSLDLAPTAFYIFLLSTLVVVAARIYLWPDPSIDIELEGRMKIVVSLVAGSILGFVAGVAGIGGGIYLVPLIVILGLGDEKQAAAAGAIFILVNSAAGLTAHLQRQVPPVEFIGPLVGAVIIGGFVGSKFGASKFSRDTVRQVLGLVVLLAIALLSYKLLA